MIFFVVVWTIKPVDIILLYVTLNRFPTLVKDRYYNRFLGVLWFSVAYEFADKVTIQRTRITNDATDTIGGSNISEQTFLTKYR